MVKKTQEFHDNKSENSGESIGGAVLIRVNMVTQFCLKKNWEENRAPWTQHKSQQTLKALKINHFTGAPL